MAQLVCVCGNTAEFRMELTGVVSKHFTLHPGGHVTARNAEVKKKDSTNFFCSRCGTQMESQIVGPQVLKLLLGG